MTTEKILVNITKSYGECEDCGGYECGSVTVTSNGKTICHKTWNGHLGGSIGGPDHDLPEFLEILLSSLGLNSEIEVEET